MNGKRKQHTAEFRFKVALRDRRRSGKRAGELFLRVPSARSTITHMLSELIRKQNKFTDREGFPPALRIDACHVEERRIDPTLECVAKGFTPERKSSFDEIAEDRLVQDGFLGAFRL